MGLRTHGLATFLWALCYIIINCGTEDSRPGDLPVGRASGVLQTVPCVGVEGEEAVGGVVTGGVGLSPRGCGCVAHQPLAAAQCRHRQH